MVSDTSAGLLRTLTAVAAGLVVGGATNMAVIMLGSEIIPAPSGVDVSNTESLVRGMHLFETRHFVFPFLAHALGVLCGALAACLVDRRRRIIAACAIGALFFAGGVIASTMIPAPPGFIVFDLVLAYFPMAALALWMTKPHPVGSDQTRHEP